MAGDRVTVEHVFKPLAVTAGEPAGIGPELCIMLAAMGQATRCVVISDADLLRERAALIGSAVDIVEVRLDRLPAEASGENELRVISMPFAEPPRCGTPSPATAATLLDGLRLAVDGCMAGTFAGVVTGPIQKSVINTAGIEFTGHTEFLAGLTGSRQPVMLLVAGDLRVALASTHLPLRAVPAYLSQDGLRRVLQTLLDDLRRRFRISAPEIVVCGLNPHAGEDGHLGSEDRDLIAPVVNEFVASGHNVRGPLPADTAFTPAAGHKDAVLAMYHDQGLPVLKYAGFGRAVNVTLGLPIVRTSVDHGTALDIAGTGQADPGSLAAAVSLALELAAA
jgi:4-hydroxythreonine-4-phosphate dehydrogenase